LTHILEMLVNGNSAFLKTSPFRKHFDLSRRQLALEFQSRPSNLRGMNDVLERIEHALLRPDAVAVEIDRLCEEANRCGFFGVCVNGVWVARAAARLEETDRKVIATVGFPFGSCETDVKRFETEAAIDGGAHEIDMVLNIGKLKDAEHAFLLREIRDVVEAADERPVKVILETCLLTDPQKIVACELALEGGAKFVKTSTGFGAAGATVEDVRLLRKTVGDKFGVKASGGIRDLAAAQRMVEAGADRIGSSSGPAIFQELRASQ
jgi:deoxyribose-phosphate aldolase